MFLTRFAHQAQKLVADNSPIILTAVGVAGTVGTAILTGKATLKLTKVLEEEENRRLRMNEPEEMDKVTYLKLGWKLYIPAVSAGATTIAAIVCANRISTRRAAAMAAAYSLSERAYSEYKDKVVERFTASKEQKVRDEIAQDRVNQTPLKDAQVIITGNGDVLCFDLPTGRYFRSNMEAIRSVQNDINAQVCETGYATLSDLYAALKLTSTPFSEEIGWTTDRLLQLDFSAAMSDDNQPCISINYHASSIREYNQPN